ncbi:hypothetical protein [Streptomyces similanensis]|uniref:Uncharacterized protein n=1 Tax=Streptomyces similanensis TaxID=1274988 RepID=A0ABP9LAK6_9ACTN
MGYLRKRSFLIFHDPDAPAEEKTLDQQEITAIEAAHEAGKNDRVEALIRAKLGIEPPKLHTKREQTEALRNLAEEEDISVFDLVTEDVLVAAIVEQRKQELARELEGADEEEAKELKAEAEGTLDPAAILAQLPTDEEERLGDLRSLAAEEDISVPDLATGDVLVAAIVEQRKQELARELEGADEEEAKELKAEAEGTLDPAAILAQFPTDEAVVKAAEEAAAERVGGPDGAPWRAIVQAVQDESIVDENAFKQYLRTTFPDTNQQYLRSFAWDVYGIVTSRAKLPDLTYRPERTSESTVRFRDGRTDRLGINSHLGESRWDHEKNQTVATGQTAATLWVKIADGAWCKDGNWGGRLQVTCATAQGQWIDSSDGWVRPQPAKGDPVTFYDMGPYYEIWQKDRETGRPLTVQDGYLRFMQAATPGKFNLQDSTWD